MGGGRKKETYILIEHISKKYRCKKCNDKYIDIMHVSEKYRWREWGDKYICIRKRKKYKCSKKREWVIEKYKRE